MQSPRLSGRLARARAALRLSKTSHAIAAVLAAVLAAGVTIVIDEPTPDHHTVTVHVGKVSAATPQAATTKVDNADPNAAADNTVTLGSTARAVANTLAAGAASGANDLQPKEDGIALAGKITGPIAQLQPPFASDSIPGCRTRFLTTNWSARAEGTRVQALALHYTAGPDVPGSRSEVDGLTAFGNRPSAAVSWTASEDKDGNCDYNVPYRYKSWTIAGLNSVTANYEIAGTGTAPYLRPGGYRQLARMWIDFHRRYPYIPLRLGATDGNCHITRTGIITHWMGGPCSGGHVDIKPLAISHVIATLKKYVAAASCDRACRLAKEARKVRAIHQRTHQRLVKNHCTKGQGGYCKTLRDRNKAVHLLARRDAISLAGTYR